MPTLQATRRERNRKNPVKEANKLHPEDRAAHDWYRFVLSYPPHLVREYLQRFEINESHCVLDPFCGTGTTVVECKKIGIPSIGLEANPVAAFAGQTKVNWNPEPELLIEHSNYVANAVLQQLRNNGIEDNPIFPALQQAELDTAALRTLPPEVHKLLLTNSISPLPLHKSLLLIEHLDKFRNEQFYPHQTLALAKALVSTISNLRFGPEVGVGTLKTDAPVISSWLDNIRSMADDLHHLQNQVSTLSMVHLADARDAPQVLAPRSIDAVITSPPYPNEKDYTRTTRLESVLLGFIGSKEDLRSSKRTLVRSNTRGVYKGDCDDEWVADHGEIQRLAAAIEARRIELGKTSGFEKLYGRVTKLYFGGMARHLAELRPALRPGAQLAYVVGDQASYLRVMIRTGQLLADIAQSLGYELVGIDLFRTRAATATKQQLREEVVVLRWPGFEGEVI